MYRRSSCLYTQLLGWEKRKSNKIQASKAFGTLTETACDQAIMTYSF